jgi:hypothetical protein
MNDIVHFKNFVRCSGDVAADVDHLHVKRIHKVGFSYIVIDDTHSSYIKFNKTYIDTSSSIKAKQLASKSSCPRPPPSWLPPPLTVEPDHEFI